MKQCRLHSKTVVMYTVMVLIVHWLVIVKYIYLFIYIFIYVCVYSIYTIYIFIPFFFALSHLYFSQNKACQLFQHYAVSKLTVHVNEKCPESAAITLTKEVVMSGTSTPTLIQKNRLVVFLDLTFCGLVEIFEFFVVNFCTYSFLFFAATDRCTII
jgi:hypothetical protein